MGFLDEDRVLEVLPFAFLKAEMVNPEEKCLYEKGLVRVREAVEFENHVL